MSKGLLPPQLKRYKISIDDSDWISPPNNSRALKVKLNTNDKADEVILQLKGIKQLELVADGSDDFTGSKQSVSLDALFSLESLSLEDLNLEKICNVPLSAGSFRQLRTITMHNCHKLTNIFSFSIDRVLPNLQAIEVSCCENMEEIFAIEREDDVNNTQLIHEIEFSQLCSVTLRRLPQLKSVCHRVKTTSQMQLTSSTNDGDIISEDIIDIPKSLFNEKVVFPNLETLKISSISAERIWHNQLPTMSSSFQNLNRLLVHNCDNLKELFPSSMVNGFVQLQYIQIYECSRLEEMVFMEELRAEEKKDIQFPFLKEMKITSCPNFKTFISDDKIGFPSLKAMDIQGCPKFKEFIFNDKVAVPNLEKLEIFYMDNLEKIWHNQIVKDSFCKLKSLEVKCCRRLLNVFPSNIHGRLLSSLESLEVDECDSLEEIFDLGELSNYDSQILILPLANLQKLSVSWM
ncbi:hypothetical protein Ddye_027121 [Dipteronia dyeriana]|uniref:Disease resistance protein At4g27190-like leucine-rich repeats domain-containing protein n=1 Tax=Dipteronia dyeriana TaxID=168575 RepID=A0AAD9TNP0_9ROSI|nr:hypothetical protein Ddye_027121 [Dipteronia dyeriana]